MKARVVINFSVMNEDKKAVADIVAFKREIENGQFQRDFSKVGARKVTATFEWLEK